MGLITLEAKQIKLLRSKGLFIDPAARLHSPVVLAPPVRLWACTLSHESQVDAFSYVSPNSLMHRVSIGRYCSIGDGVSILSSHPTDRLTAHPMTYESIFGSPFEVHDQSFLKFDNKLKTTRIGNDVWIGAGTKIMTGVSIGDGCIIGAGSVVTKDIEPFSVVAGVPAMLIRKRFTDSMIERIKKVVWWQYNLLGHKLQWNDITTCLDQIEDLVIQGQLKPYKPQWIRLA